MRDSVKLHILLNCLCRLRQNFIVCILPTLEVMYSLSYISDAVVAPITIANADAEAELVRSILRQSRRNNAASEVSGLLAYAHGVFLQVLEGEQAVVESLYSRVSADARHHNIQVLHRGTISERIYADWGMGSAFRLGSVNDHAARIAFLRSRFGKDRLASSADYFRYLLTPSRISTAGSNGHVRRVGIFASSALWFTPVFNAIADVYGVRPNSVLVSDPDTVSSGFPVDYVDIGNTNGNAVRITGFGNDLLRSPLIGPFLKGIDLLVVLMRRSDVETNAEKLHRVLSMRDMKIAKPDVICIAPNMDEKLGGELSAIGQSFGVNVQTASASLLMGNDVLAIIKGWLAKHKLASNTDHGVTDINDSITIPANAILAAPHTAPSAAEATATATAPNVEATVETNTSTVLTAAATNQVVKDEVQDWALLAITRIMYLPGAMQCFFINVKTAQVIASDKHPLHAPSQQWMIESIVNKFALIGKVGLDDEVIEMVTTTTTTYEVVIQLSDLSSLALVTLFDRESTLLAALLTEIRSVIAECEHLSTD